MKNIEKFKLEEKTRLSYLKHRGDVVQVAKELEVPLDYVRKVQQKVKRRCQRDISYWISSTLAEYLFFGHQQRVQYLTECLVSLKGKEEAFFSVCCDSPVEGKGKCFKCLMCKKKCYVRPRRVDEVYDYIFQALGILRQEDESLVDCLDKLGYTNRPVLPVQNIQQNLLYLGKGDSGVDEETMREVGSLTPMERERIRKKLEQRIGDAACSHGNQKETGAKSG